MVKVLAKAEVTGRLARGSSLFSRWLGHRLAVSGRPRSLSTRLLLCPQDMAAVPMEPEIRERQGDRDREIRPGRHHLLMPRGLHHHLCHLPLAGGKSLIQTPLRGRGALALGEKGVKGLGTVNKIRYARCGHRTEPGRREEIRLWDVHNAR